MGLSMERVDRQPPRMNGNSTSPSIPPGYSTPAAISESVVEEAQTSKSKNGYGSEGSVVNLKDVKFPLSTHFGIYIWHTNYFGMENFMNDMPAVIEKNITYQSLICDTKWAMVKLLAPHPPTRNGQAVAHRLSWWQRSSTSGPLRCKTVKVSLLVLRCSQPLLSCLVFVGVLSFTLKRLLHKEYRETMAHERRQSFTYLRNEISTTSGLQKPCACSCLKRKCSFHFQCLTGIWPLI